MNFVYLGLFVVITALHLYASLKNNYSLRSITKGLILMTLLGFYLETVGDNYSWLLVIALLTSWLGDMLLIGKGVKWFTAGGIGFMISHLFFIATYCEYINFANVPLMAEIVLVLIFVIAVCIIFKRLKQYLKPQLVVPMFFYLIINGMMNCFAIFRLIACPSLGSVITAIGALLFFVSDTSLFFVRFNKDSVMKSHFLVMLTYSVGEFLIVLGLMLA